MSLASTRRFVRIVTEFARKDFRILRSYKFSLVTSVFAATYGIVSFRFVSHLVGGTRYIGNSTEYFRFVVVGVITAGVVRASTVTTASNARRDQVEGTLEILATQPVPLMALGLGWSILPVLEELVVGLFTIAIAVPLGFHGISPNWPATVLVLILVAAVFIGIGFIAAAGTLAIQQGTALAGTAVAMMTLISGAVFPVAVLPEWLRAIADLSPLTYALRATRTAVLDGGNTSKLLEQLGIVAAIAAILLPFGLFALRLAFNYARSRGTLARF